MRRSCVTVISTMPSDTESQYGQYIPIFKVPKVRRRPGVAGHEDYRLDRDQPSEEPLRDEDGADRVGLEMEFEVGE